MASPSEKGAEDFNAKLTSIQARLSRIAPHSQAPGIDKNERTLPASFDTRLRRAQVTGVDLHARQLRHASTLIDEPAERVHRGACLEALTKARGSRCEVGATSPVFQRVMAQSESSRACFAGAGAKSSLRSEGSLAAILTSPPAVGTDKRECRETIGADDFWSRSFVVSGGTASKLTGAASVGNEMFDTRAEPRVAPEDTKIGEGGTGNVATAPALQKGAARTEMPKNIRNGDLPRSARARSDSPLAAPESPPGTSPSPRTTPYARELEFMRISSPQMSSRDILPIGLQWDRLKLQKEELADRKREADARQRQFLTQVGQARSAFRARTGNGTVSDVPEEREDAIERRIAAAHRKWEQARPARMAFAYGADSHMQCAIGVPHVSNSRT